MSKTVIAEGKTTEQAIENGLRSLKVPKECVSIKVLDNKDKKSFFSILAPRVVKVELTVKDNIQLKHTKTEVKVKPLDKKVEDNAIVKIREFMDEFIKKIPGENNRYEVEGKEYSINVTILGDDINFLVGYRGETLNAMQVLLSSIVNNNTNGRTRVIVDIGEYKEKRKRILEELAEKISKTVIRTSKSITLEPMSSYERKIIHDKLQSNEKIKTYSIGEEPYRRIVVSIR